MPPGPKCIKKHLLFPIANAWSEWMDDKEDCILCSSGASPMSEVVGVGTTIHFLPLCWLIGMPCRWICTAQQHSSLAHCCAHIPLAKGFGTTWKAFAFSKVVLQDTHKHRDVHSLKQVHQHGNQITSDVLLSEFLIIAAACPAGIEFLLSMESRSRTS